MKIDYPSEEEIEKSIGNIIEKATPSKKPVISCLIHLYRQIGMDFLLHGIREWFVVILVVYMVMICWQNNLEQTLQLRLYLGIVLFSPLVFQLLLALSVIGEREQGTYEIGMTCKYTVYHILALRMLLVGGISVVMNGIFCLLVYGNGDMKVLLHFLLLSITALLTYSLLYLSLLTKSCKLRYQTVLYGLWILANIVAVGMFPDVYTWIAIKVPLVFHVILWSILLVLSAWKMKRFLYCNCKYNLLAGEGIC